MIDEHLKTLEFQLANLPYVDTLTVLEREVGRVGGHIRLRGTLINGDIFEISEYVRVVQNRMEVVRYNYHWQDRSNRLIRRWDNAKHHPQIRTFPHHVRIGTEDNVHESEGINVDLFLKQIEAVYEVNC